MEEQGMSGQMPLAGLQSAAMRVREALAGRVLGQREAIDGLLIGYMARGHVLLEGLPGVGKTLLARSFAEALGQGFARVQFTPDVMPTDLIGTNVFDSAGATFRLVKGPVFTTVLMADEINRTPPKTQAALLEAMQEYHVTAAGRTSALDRPFFVLATQNPIELEGTYPLPEAQLDRFMFNIVMTYLGEDEEVRVVTQTTGVTTEMPLRVLSGAEILEIQQLVRQVIVAEEIARYAVRLVDASRPGRQGGHAFVTDWVKWGAGLRASQALILAGKARALIHGRYHVSVADIQALALPVLRHRLILNFYAESERVTPDTIVERLLEAVPVPQSGL
jgi:MoxR-like ATPase